ncbi:13279_t:CDS:2 [Dentiscutata erythropus]|uniref:13279_t:CDS:1 n=1 Tax=Dentiscutata erythropus TaxID=1348616 RepID=A0A9N9HUZ8_9GLOM|nr:13279_t:CDS:2 [Dentiscutata erythropus]
MDLFKNFFALCEEAKETFDTYLDLIYGSESANNNRNDTNSDSNDEHVLLDNNSDNDIFKALEGDNKEFMNGTEEEDECFNSRLLNIAGGRFSWSKLW